MVACVAITILAWSSSGLSSPSSISPKIPFVNAAAYVFAPGLVEVWTGSPGLFAALGHPPIISKKSGISFQLWASSNAR